MMEKGSYLQGIVEPAPSVAATGGILQRKCDCGNHAMSGACGDCANKKGSLQRKVSNDIEASAVPSIVHEVLRLPGEPLDTATRSFMEPRFGHDFSRVRVHTDARAAESARSVNALAYTVGQDIVLGDGDNASNPWERRKTLAHELTHVIQQTQSPRLSRLPLTIGSEDHHAEREAERTADRIMTNQSVAPAALGATPAGVNVIQRTPHPGCSAAVTKVKDPDSLIVDARIDAMTRISAATAQAKAPKGKTLSQFDWHFHCPNVSEMAEVTRMLSRVEAALPTLQLSCVGSSAPDCKSDTLVIEDLKLCPSFFNAKTSDQSRSAVLIASAAKTAGSPTSCLYKESCYNDFTKPAAEMVKNSYSYAYFAFDASGYAGLKQPDVIPCRPIATGFNVIVPSDAAQNPASIRRLTGYQKTPPGGEVVPVFSDRGGKYFIYRAGLPGGRVYMPGEGERYYFPKGIP